MFLTEPSPKGGAPSCFALGSYGPLVAALTPAARTMIHSGLEAFEVHGDVARIRAARIAKALERSQLGRPRRPYARSLGLSKRWAMWDRRFDCTVWTESLE